MRHGSELPKVTSVYLETAEPIDWNSTMKVCAMISHRIAYTHCTGCGGVGKMSPPLGGAAKFWPENADFAPREALNNVNNNSDCQH
jgi:hypothetical protein